jgi:hypothetical protein
MTQFLHDTYITVMNEYGAEIAQAQADFTIAQSRGDIGSAAAAGQRLADARVRAAEFDRMSREHAAALNPPPPRQLSKEEIKAIPDDIMVTLPNGPELMAQAGYYDSQWGAVEADDPALQAGKEYVRRNPIRR